MSNKSVRLTVEFDIDEEALQEHGLSANDVFKHICFCENPDADGFLISTNIPGFSPTSDIFLVSGQVVSQEFISERSRCDGLDQWRQMVRDEIDVNSDVYGLTDEEKDLLIADSSVVDHLSERMELYMGRGDRNEYEALDIAFENDFPEMVKCFREERVSDALGFFCVGIEDNAICCGMVDENEIKIFRDENDNLFCQLADEDFARPLKDKIQDIRNGDAFFFTNSGWIRTAADDAHQNFDEPDAPWIAYGDDGECYFEEDIGTDLGEKVRNLMKNLNPCQVQAYSLADKILEGERGKRDRADSVGAPEKDFDR